MGQKVHPVGFRVGVTRDWNSRWYASKEEFPKKILQDSKIRKMIEKELSTASISHVDIERTIKRVRVLIYAGRPGLIIGRKGAQIEKLKEDIQNVIGEEAKLMIDIKEVGNPALDAKITADSISFQLEKRISFRRAMKKALQGLKDAGGEGIKVRCAGRLGGAEIARAEGYKWGKIPLQTIRADIDYGTSEAKTTYGVIGVKVWIYKGEKYARGLAARRPAKEESREDKDKAAQKTDIK